MVRCTMSRSTWLSVVLFCCVLYGWQHVSSRLVEEQKTAKTSTKLMSVLDAGYTSVLITDGEGVVTGYNRNASHLLGVNLAGQSLPQLLMQQRQRDLSALVASAQLAASTKVVLAKTVWHDRELLVTIWVATSDQGEPAVAMTLLPFEQAEVKDGAIQNHWPAAPVARAE